MGPRKRGVQKLRIEQGGPRPARLTATGIEALEPRASRYEVTDPGCEGLQLRIEPTGSKGWLFRYYWQGKRVRLALGPWPRITLAYARELAVEARRTLDRRIDPRSAGIVARATKATPHAPTTTPTESRHSVTFLVGEFMRRHVRPKRKRPEYVQRILDVEVVPTWGTRDARTIKPREVVELLDAIVDRGSPIMANRVAAALGQLFRFGIHRQIVEDSPVKLLYRPGGAERSRSRALSAEELAAFVKHRHEACRYPRLAHILMILLLTGQRRGELAFACWADVDLKAKTWRIPDEIAKAGRGHILPLSDAAVTEFEELKKLAGRSKFVLPAKDDGAPLDPKLITRGVAKCQRRFKAKGIAAFTAHDLRRTCRTGLAKLGVSNDIAERVLNHTREKIEGTYDVHEYLPEKRAALDRWSIYLSALGTKSNGPAAS